MPSWGRSLLVTGALTFIGGTIGCVADDAGPAPGTFPWVTQAESPGRREELKNPGRLDLSYAQWQEQLGNLPAAEESYQRVLKAHPRSLDAMIGLARLEQLAGRTDSAEQAYVRAVRSAPGDVRALDALGQFYVAEKRWPQAESTYASAIEAEPGCAACRQHYAVALARSGKTSAALAQFKQAVGEAEGHYNLGYVLFEEGRSDLAEREFLQAIALRPDLEAAQTMLDEVRRGGDEKAVLAGGVPLRPSSGLAGPPPTEHGRIQNAAASTGRPAAGPSVVQTSASATRGQVRHAGAAQEAGQPADWQMPERCEASTLQAEQMRNQSALPDRR